MHINKKNTNNKRNCLNIAQASLDALLLEFMLFYVRLLLFCNNITKNIQFNNKAATHKKIQKIDRFIGSARR